jgi:hypothetical protein
MTDLSPVVSDLESLVIRSFFAVDNGRREHLCPIADDFAMELPHMAMTREQYLTFIEGRMSAEYTTRHCLSNFVITADDGTVATIE